MSVSSGPCRVSDRLASSVSALRHLHSLSLETGCLRTSFLCPHPVLEDPRCCPDPPRPVSHDEPRALFLSALPFLRDPSSSPVTGRECDPAGGEDGPFQLMRNPSRVSSHNGAMTSY